MEKDHRPQLRSKDACDAYDCVEDSTELLLASNKVIARYSQSKTKMIKYLTRLVCAARHISHPQCEMRTHLRA